MADYIAQPDTAVDPDAPVTSDLMYALRDNPIAIAEGAAGAPRVQDAALSLTVTVEGRNWVANRYASQQATGIGQVIMARYQSAGSGLGSGLVMNLGDEVNGSELRPCNVSGEISTTVTGIPGRWSCQGFANSGATASAATVWKRVA